MIGEASLFGLYLPWVMVLAACALPATWAVRRLLAFAGLYRWVWHPALFVFSVYTVVLSLIVLLPLSTKAAPAGALAPNMAATRTAAARRRRAARLRVFDAIDERMTNPSI